MKSIDGRKKNDNSKAYRLEKEKKNSVLIVKAIELLRKSKQKINPASVSRVISEYFSDEGTITSAAIRKNPAHEALVLKAQQEVAEVTDVELEGISLPVIQKEKYKLALENQELKNEIKILKACLSEDEEKRFLQMKSVPAEKGIVTDIPHDAIKKLVKVLMGTGECFMKGGSLYLEEDGSVLLTKGMMKELDAEK